MYVALLSLLINATLNYVLAFIFDYGHVGIAIGSSVAALLSVLILEIILLRDGFIEIKNPLNRFNFAIMMASSFLILFLYNFTNKTELISMTQIERLIYLGFEIIIAISIYFIVARLVSGKSLIKTIQFRMYLIRGQHNLELFNKKFPNEKLCGTIGNFDGLHLGHQAILKKIKLNAEKFDAKTIVFFTEPHAAEYFATVKKNNMEAPPRIFPWRKKVMLLKDFGINYAFFLKFNNSLRTMTPDEFITEILESINLVSFTVGDDFRFGADRKGDTNLFKEIGEMRRKY